jgi:hypothetical protein
VCANSTEKPKFGDWVCWANVKEETYKECGTYAYSKNKEYSKKLAIDKCKEHCQRECYIEYCEKLKKE